MARTAKSPSTSPAEAAKPLSMFGVIQAGADAAVAADPRPLAVGKSRTMALIDKLVEGLPPFPIFGPLPVFGTTDTHLDKPCSSPKARLGWPGVGNPCMCGFEMGEHPKGGAK